MKATVLAYPQETALAPSRLADYLALTKPRIALLVLFTVAVGTLLAGGGAVDPLLLVNTVLGTALVASGASALNQWLERESDARMQRTENRPLPAGRLQPLEVILFGLALGVIGVGYLALTLRQPGTPLVAAVTFLSYVGLYTPLKRRTVYNTLIGAVPGALPPVIGWSAVRGLHGLEVWTLFAILFLWQVPHFMAIAWIYRADYAQAGLQMIPVDDQTGRRTARHMVGFALLLLVISLVPLRYGMGPIYLVGALLLGLGFLARTLGFARRPSDQQARRVLRASLIYLPGLFALLLVDGLFRP